MLQQLYSTHDIFENDVDAEGEILMNYRMEMHFKLGAFAFTLTDSAHKRLGVC